MADTHGLQALKPHELPNQLRICFRGILTMEQAQERLGSAWRVLEVCPAKVASEDKSSNVLAEATEVIFAAAS